MNFEVSVGGDNDDQAAEIIHSIGDDDHGVPS